jgi:NADH-quinone oxidoreductase subunit J
MELLTSEDVLFHVFALVATMSAVLVVLMRSPIYSALFLALTMSILGIFFFMLHAPFVAVAQITVYAGAVMVLFIMVVMLFDLNKEHEDIFKFSPVTITKLLGSAILCGFLMGVAWLGVSAMKANSATMLAPATTQGDLDKTRPIVKADPVNPDEDLTEAEAANFVEHNKANVAPPETKTAGTIVKEEEFGSSVTLSQRLFSKYVFAFEAVSLLFLVAIVGAVALAKSKGGTHHVAR